MNNITISKYKKTVITHQNYFNSVKVHWHGLTSQFSDHEFHIFKLNVHIQQISIEHTFC